jgi:hypothetical protein
MKIAGAILVVVGLVIRKVAAEDKTGPQNSDRLCKKRTLPVKETPHFFLSLKAQVGNC